MSYNEFFFHLADNDDEDEDESVYVEHIDMEDLNDSIDNNTVNKNSEPKFAEILPIIPLKGVVVFPFAVTPLAVGQERSIALIEDAMRSDKIIGLVAQKDPDLEQGGPDDTFRVGAVARIARLIRLPDGNLQIMAQGLERIVIDEYVQETPYLKAKTHVSKELVENDIETEALKRSAVDLFQKMVGLVQYLSEELAMAIINLEDPRQIVYFIASTVKMDLHFRQELLEMDSVRAKLEKVIQFLNKELEILELGKKLQNQAQDEMTKAQREYYLREQIKAIQKELGEESDDAAAINELRSRIQKAGLSESALKEANRELSRLEKISAASPEYSVIRTYLEMIVSLPWNQMSESVIDIQRSRETLDHDHYDLEKIKDRILEYLAVRKLREERFNENGEGSSQMHEPVLCFVGPPGVGKTSLGQSIARSLNRKFVRLSLGGIRDEAEIRGHRRTYIGAMPGNILQSLRRIGVRNPVFMLDEVDKLGADWRGDPSSALLEVLDPEQNFSFRDNYLDLPFDLSQIMFIATANEMERIPPALLDRMEVISLSGYTEEQKVHIARTYLLPKQLKAAALLPEELIVSDDAIQHIIREYTREAGVRNLERKIADVCRKATKAIAAGSAKSMNVTKDSLYELLGRPIAPDETFERIDRPGVAAGLSVTPYGGDVLFVEAAMMPSAEEQLVLTGQLGNVMKESAQTALTYVRSNAAEFGIDPHVFRGMSVHIHVPAGATPKDGPSAGVTIATAIVSLVKGQKVRWDVAMTGEISLRGKALPIGGLRDKALAAHRLGIHTVIFPKGNEMDLDDFPQDLKQEMQFLPVSDVSEVIAIALAEPE